MFFEFLPLAANTSFKRSAQVTLEHCQSETLALRSNKVKKISAFKRSAQVTLEHCQSETLALRYLDIKPNPNTAEVPQKVPLIE